MTKLHSSGFRAIAASSIVGLVLGAVVVFAPLHADEDELPWRFNANAVNTGRVGPRTARLEISVSRWTTQEERAALMEVIRNGSEGGSSNALATALFEQEVAGTFRQTGSLNEQLRYSRRVPTKEGQQILLATDRPLAMVEVWRGTRTRDYNVTLIILNLDQDGNGEGQIIAGADFSWDSTQNQISIEHLAAEPIRLNNIRMR